MHRSFQLFGIFLLLFSFNMANELRAQSGPICGNNIYCVSQGWNEADRQDWYWLSQGSRLIPEAWANVLRVDDNKRFFDAAHFDKFGYVRAYPGDRWPIGFARDRDRLSGTNWIGLNCAACHTTQIDFAGKKLRVDGAATLADFQAMLESLVNSVRTTFDTKSRWQLFVSEVLGAGASESQKNRLRNDVQAWLKFREGLWKRNTGNTPEEMRYGPGRLDAVGNILNTVAHALSPSQPIMWPSDAPVSYPFIWNARQHDRIQWNGMASNTFPVDGIPPDPNLNGLARNIGQVIGVFGHMQMSTGVPHGTRLSETSVRIDNLIRLERILSRLESPRWPEPIDRESQQYLKGKALYVEHCQECHKLLAADDLTSKVKAQMQPIFSPKASTDPWMACNTLMHASESGTLEGGNVAHLLSSGPVIRASEPTSKLLVALVIRTVINRREDLSRVLTGNAASWFRSVADTPKPLGIQPLAPSALESARPPLTALDEVNARKKQLLAKCKLLAAGGPDKAKLLLQYKGRPLNGIWATAPYMHNGSVPTLYDLLLPPAKRPKEFYVGSTKFDRKNVGFTSEKTPNSFLFRTRDRSQKPIPGNSNAGHLYGVDLREDDRRSLVHYLKTL